MQLEHIQEKIYLIRGQKVMLDFDLAELYETETRILKQAVRRNADRFPIDFMFQLRKSEWQKVITICDNLPKGIKFSPIEPLAFTEQGVAMLSSVLKSKKAVQVNISIMRAFVFIRQYALSHQELTEKLLELESKYDLQFKDVYEAINFLLEKEEKQVSHEKRRRIGFENPD